MGPQHLVRFTSQFLYMKTSMDICEGKQGLCYALPPHCIPRRLHGLTDIGRRPFNDPHLGESPFPCIAQPRVKLCDPLVDFVRWPLTSWNRAVHLYCAFVEAACHQLTSLCFCFLNPSFGDANSHFGRLLPLASTLIPFDGPSEELTRCVRLALAFEDLSQHL